MLLKLIVFKFLLGILKCLDAWRLSFSLLFFISNCKFILFRYNNVSRKTSSPLLPLLDSKFSILMKIVDVMENVSKSVRLRINRSSINLSQTWRV